VRGAKASLMVFLGGQRERERWEIRRRIRIRERRRGTKLGSILQI
jgi:hypothetical protein